MLKDAQFLSLEDTKFQRRIWAGQRAAWAIFLIIPVLALTGLFANGALSSRKISSEALSIDYEAFQRVTALTRFVVHFPATQDADLLLGPRFQQVYEIESITPLPAKSAAGSDGLRLSFNRSAGPLEAVIWARPRSFGLVRFAAQGSGAPVTLDVLVYP